MLMTANLPAVTSRLNRLLYDAWLPPVDVTENGDALLVEVEVPGVPLDDLKVSLENNLLTIRGKKRQEIFERSFTLPATVDADRITATYDHGMLTVTLPKVERARPREITVSVRK